MTEKEIYNKLCSCIYILDVDNPMEKPFFLHCYDKCIERKDGLTDSTIWDIIQNEEHSLKLKNEAIINEIKIVR